MRRLRFFRCKHGSNFEIFEYEAPDQNLTQPKNSDVGGHHLAFYVDDFDAAVAYLSERGSGSWVRRQSGRWGQMLDRPGFYFLSPWGMQLELVSFPNGKGYEKDTELRLWHPVNPAA